MLVVMVSMGPRKISQTFMNSSNSTSNGKSLRIIRMISADFNRIIRTTIGLDTKIDSSSKKAIDTLTLIETVSDKTKSQEGHPHREAWTIQTGLLSQWL